MIRLKILYLKLIGDWFCPVSRVNGDFTTWGVFHPIRQHDWGFSFLIRIDAQRECDKLNKETLNSLWKK